jgi:hypothetical protein
LPTGCAPWPRFHSEISRNDLVTAAARGSLSPTADRRKPGGGAARLLQKQDGIVSPFSPGGSNVARGTSKFDQMFHSLIGEDDPKAPPIPASGQRDSHFDTGVESQIQKAMALFHAGRYAHCLSEVRKLETAATDEPRVAALLGACNALVSGRLRPGIERCAELIEQTFYIPELYCALGVLLVKSRHRAQAYQVFRKGLKIDPQHRALHGHMRDMGLRRRPVLRFLARTHPANRALGLVRSRLVPA